MKLDLNKEQSEWSKGRMVDPAQKKDTDEERITTFVKALAIAIDEGRWGAIDSYDLWAAASSHREAGAAVRKMFKTAWEKAHE